MKTGRPEDLLAWLKPGQRVYFQGGPGECSAFIDLLKADPAHFAGVELWSCLIPGINTFDYGSLPGGPDLVTFMASPTLAPSIQSGRTRIDAMPYSGIAALLGRTDFDLAVLHTALPDANGLCSFGIACEAPGIVWPRAERRVAFMNERMPRIPRADAIPADRIDAAIPIDMPLLSPAPPGLRSPALNAIAGIASRLVPDDALIQSGIGEAPAAILAALKDHRGLRFHSGIVTAEYRLLAEAGTLDPGGENVAGIAWGAADFYAWLVASDIAAFRSALVTHDHQAIGRLPRFTSIGSAIDVDLEGNINLEWVGERRVSSVGGAPDYVRAAAASAGGRSIIALPATAGSGASRIVRRLSPRDISLPANLADAIVTEHGAALLRGLSPAARVQAMIGIAAPRHRPALAG